MNIDINKISNNTKSIVVLVMLIGEGAWLVLSIHANEKEIQITDARNEKEIQITDARSEKRYKRGMVYAKDHESRLRKLEAFMNFNKGENSKKYD